MENKKIILFDGVCNLCNGAVQFAIKRDKKDVFRYAPLQSALGEKMIAERGIDSSLIDSMILVEPGKAYFLKSTAALRIAQEFGGLWRLLRVLELFPAGLRNSVYDLVAKNRYKWFGKKEACMIPTPELQAKFLD